MAQNEFDYIDQLIKQKLDNYSVPVNLSPDKIFKPQKTSKSLFKWIGAGVTFIGIIFAGLFGFNKKPTPAQLPVMPKYKIEHIRQVTEKPQEVEQPEVKQQQKQPNKKIVVVTIEETETDTIRK